MKTLFVLAAATLGLAQMTSAQKLHKIGCSTPVAEALNYFSQKIDTTKGRAVLDNYHTWDPGQVILVKFMPGGSKVMRDRVMQNAKEWEKYGNITFKFVADTTKNTDLRVRLSRGYGHNSAVGTEAAYRSQNEQTINFDTLYFADIDYYLAKLKSKGINAPYNWDQIIAEMKTDPNHWNGPELKRVVMHEFGHALGLLHEQSYPGVVKWKKTDSVYNYYYQTQKWDRRKVDFNVFEVSNQFFTNGTTYDPKSIMHYSIEPWQTTDGYSLKDNYELSAGDKAIVAALYPKDPDAAKGIVPKVSVSNFGKMDVVSDVTRKGLVIKPSFDLKTNSKLGEVYFVARLATEDGYYIKTANLYYNWGGTAATYMQMNLLPNSKVSYNKGGKNNLELFLPFDQMPELNGKKIMVVFAVYLDDVENKQMDKLMYFSTTEPLSVITK